MRNQYKVLQEAYNQVDSQHNEVQQIVNTCRGIVQGYLKLLNNKKISGAQLADYVQKKTNPMLEYIGSYIVHSTPQEKAKFINYLKELLTTNWLEVDEQYWLEEMNKLVKGAVEYGEVNLDNLDDLVKEDDKEDIMAGLDELSVNPNDPISVTNLMKLGFVQRFPTRNASMTFHRPDVTGYIIVWKNYYTQTWYVDTTQEYAAAPVYTPTTMGELEKAYNSLLKYINTRANAHA